MTVEMNKYIIRSYFAALDRSGISGAEPFLAVDFLAHVNALAQPMDATAFQSFYDEFYCALPDLKHGINEIIADGERVVVRLTAVGRHSGRLDGLRPCGKILRIPMLMIIQLSSGKIDRIWLQFDQLYLLQQIGAIPSTQTQTV